MLTRRRLIQGAGTAAVIAIAGCAEDIDDDDVNVINREPSELTDPGTGPIEVRVLVHNIGAAADVEIMLEVVDFEQDVIETASTVETFERDEQRNVFIEITPGPTGDIIFAEAQAV